MNLLAQKPSSKLRFARVIFICASASRLNWGGFPKIVRSVSCSCLGEHFLVTRSASGTYQHNVVTLVSCPTATLTLADTSTGGVRGGSLPRPSSRWERVA